MNDMTPPPDRLGIGGNNPSLEDATIIAFDMALNEHEGLIARISEMVARAAKAGPCKNDDDAGRMGDFIKAAQAAAKTIEAERETLNRPILTTQRTLKSRADALINQAMGAAQTVRALLDTYLAAKREAARVEAARVAEIERQAELARQRVIDEANRQAALAAEAERQRLQKIADEAARVERLRLQAIVDENARVERLRLQAIEDARAAAEAREAAVVVIEAEVVELAAEVVEVEAAPVITMDHSRFVPTAAPVSQIQGDYGTKVGTVETWHVEITNIRQVPDMFLRNEAVIEALCKVIAPAVRGKTGLRDIRGCRIYSTTGSAVR